MTRKLSYYKESNNTQIGPADNQSDSRSNFVIIMTEGVILAIPLNCIACMGTGSLVWGFARVSWQPSRDLRADRAGEENGAEKSAFSSPSSPGSQIAARPPRYSLETPNK